MKNIARYSMVAGSVLVAASAAVAQTSDTRIPVTKEAATTGALPRATSTSANPGGAFTVTNLSAGDIAVARAWTEKNVMEHFIAGDSLEVEMSRLATTKAQSAAVRELANTLMADHSKNMATLVEMAKDEDIGRQRAANDTSARHMMSVINRLRGLSGAAFDREFVKHQVMHHHHALQTLAATRPAAHDDDFEKHLDDMRPALEKHLAAAQSAAGAIGMTVHMGMDHSAHKPPQF